MKKILSLTVLTLSLLGSMAMAYQGVLVPGLNGEVKIQPLHIKCDDGTPQPLGINQDPMAACDPGNRDCPKDQQRTPKYCWGGWHHGFYKCGFACRPIQQPCFPGYDGPDCSIHAGEN